MNWKRYLYWVHFLSSNLCFFFSLNSEININRPRSSSPNLHVLKSHNWAPLLDSFSPDYWRCQWVVLNSFHSHSKLSRNFTPADIPLTLLFTVQTTSSLNMTNLTFTSQGPINIYLYLRNHYYLQPPISIISKMLLLPFLSASRVFFIG